QVAVRLALDLVHVPSRIRNTRSEPLPEGVRILLQIAAGDQEALFNAAKLVDRTEDEIRAAAAFFIEQVLLAPDADSYRILGASPHASAAELRQNMVLLMRWLHPDIHLGGPQRVLACRVTGAWDTIKTAERRLAYDQ